MSLEHSSWPACTPGVQAFDELGEELYCAILSVLDVRTLLSGPALVNKAWLRLATSPVVWRQKCGNWPGEPLPSSECFTGPWPALWFALYRNNMAPPFPPKRQQAIRATEGSWRTTKHVLQEIDLAAELAHHCADPCAAAAFLDQSPPIKFDVWVGPDAGLGGLCQVTVFVDGGDVCLPHYRGTSSSFAWERDAMKSWRKSLQFNDVDSHWQSHGSSRIEMHLQDYPPGVRRVCIVLGAQGVDLAEIGGPWFAEPHLSFMEQL
ncbi:hypothetical protein WJX73_008795 [Symbiochloris irregularis]|uniref:F-box domain-containing protein n=1 Tax=Symbiochloris irregularis TaxID=706552 RepID=A0AAW1PKL2_9CHLO